MKPWINTRPPSKIDLLGEFWVTDSVTGETFYPINENRLRMYVCGITPYDSAHLGHIFTYLIFDVINRVALGLGAQVNYVQNVTDIDDPLFERARETGRAWDEIAAEQIGNFKNSLEFLEIIPPEAYILVTEEIDEIESDLSKLKDHMYQTNHNFYFKSRLDQLMEFTGLDEAKLIEIADQRGGDSKQAGKFHPLDPKLWVESKPDEPYWYSALGAGRPGWHIECVSIANKYLGNNFDLQGGGSDLLFPHHAFCNELSLALNGSPLARGFIHVSLVGYQGEKMSKSLGNLVFLKDLADQGFDPSEIRLALLLQDWRKPWEFNFTLMESAREMLKRWKSAYLDSKLPKIDVFREVISSNLLHGLFIHQTLLEFDKCISISNKSSDREIVSEYLDSLFGINIKNIDGEANELHN